MQIKWEDVNDPDPDNHIVKDNYTSKLTDTRTVYQIPPYSHETDQFYKLKLTISASGG